MAPSFGTSGLRGLVVELTDTLVSDYVNAFLTTVPDCDTLYVGRDLRPSSPDIAEMISKAAQDAQMHVVDCGALPTPALALASMDVGAAAIMVTGSHIPADRNGLKFYIPSGEISKADEMKITAAYASGTRKPSGSGSYRSDPTAITRFTARYVDAFGSSALSGMKIGVYRHSSVARDSLTECLQSLGANTVSLGHSDVFIPVDTEAVDDETRKMLKEWAQTHALDAIVSTDGDADRPMLTDAEGNVIPGDILGVITSQFLNAKTIVTPVSSNDMVRRCPEFSEVILTKIGSPYVIADMEKIRTMDPSTRCIGFEANGGYLLGFEAVFKGALPALMTRDCMLPIIAPLLAATTAGQSLTEIGAALPACFTSAGRLQEISRPTAVEFLQMLIDDHTARSTHFAPIGVIESIDLTDGLRMNFETADVVHLRLSGNAPEFRIYAQSSSSQMAHALAQQAEDIMRPHVY